jgi:hypothetical protein
MPDIKLYDYQREPHNPRVQWTVSYAMPERKAATLHCKAPWVDDNILCCYYDNKENLIGVRFVYKDGAYVDLIKVEDK